MESPDHTISQLDDIDLRILDALQRDASLSTADLAELVGLSQSPCWRRLSRLKDAGYIRDQVTLLNAEKLGFTSIFFAHVKLTAHGRTNLTEFADAIRKMPEVLEAYATLGSFDFLLRIVTRDVKAYEEFVYGRLSSVPTVQEINSTLALSVIKATTALPIRAR
jgi:Lrp/AsnC family transcriptional regulator